MTTPTRVTLAAGGFAALAACAFIAIRVGAHATSPVTLAGIRFFSASAGFAALAMLRPGWIRWRFMKRDIPQLLLTGATGAVIYSLALIKGQQTASAGTASLIGATIPIWASVLAVTLGKERLSAGAWAGVAIAFGGTLIITVDPAAVGRFETGAAFVLLAALSNAVYFVAVRQLVIRYGALSAVAGTVWAGSILFLPLVFWMEPVATWTAPAVAAGLFLGLAATLGGASLFAYVIGHVGAARASTVTYLVAPMVVLLEWMVFQAGPESGLLVGGALTITGLFLVRPRFKRTSDMAYTDRLMPVGENAIHVRSAIPTDIPSLLRLTKELAKFQDLDNRFAATEAGIRAGLFGRHRSAEALVAEKDGTIVGYAIVSESFSSTRGARKLIVEDLFVAPHERGCGAGFALFRKIAKKAKKMGACQAEWAVQRDNKDALAFYDRMGAKPSSKWVTCSMDGIAMEGLLSPSPDEHRQELGLNPRSTRTLDTRLPADCC